MKPPSSPSRWRGAPRRARRGSTSASVLVAADRCADAITAFERALATDSAHSPSRLGLAECALAQGNTALALKQVETARRIDSTAVSAVGLRYASWTRAGARWPIRRGRHGRSGRCSPARRLDSASAFRWLAQLLMMRGRYGEALPMLQRVVATCSAGRRRAGALLDNLVLEATAYTAIGGRTRASELIDEAVGCRRSAGRSRRTAISSSAT